MDATDILATYAMELKMFYQTADVLVLITISTWYLVGKEEIRIEVFSKIYSFQNIFSQYSSIIRYLKSSFRYS